MSLRIIVRTALKFRTDTPVKIQMGFESPFIKPPQNLKAEEPKATFQNHDLQYRALHTIAVQRRSTNTSMEVM